jgi:hypothetical protein
MNRGSSLSTQQSLMNNYQKTPDEVGWYLKELHMFDVKKIKKSFQNDGRGDQANIYANKCLNTENTVAMHKWTTPSTSTCRTD